MKKLFTLITICAVLCVLLLTGCNLFPNNSSGDNTSGVIFDKNSIIQYVEADEKMEFEVSYALYTELGKVLNTIPDKVKDNAEVKNKEFVIGKSNRDISKKAYDLLERVELQDKKSVRYLVYTDGNSVAFAYDKDKYETDAAARMAIQTFIDSYVTGKDSFSHKKGVILSGTVNPIEYMEALEDAEYEKKYDQVRKELLNSGASEALAEEIITEYKKLNAGYDDDVATWIANLYDPYICYCEGDECQGTMQCGGGGFYYSNAARDTEGFMPDLESTKQALMIIERLFGVELPREMQEDIARWVKSLQDPSNGYFYHPQWSKKETDANPSRIGRDLEHANGILQAYGYKPTYDIPTYNVKGDGLYADGTPIPVASHITGRLSSASTVVMVSKVVPTSSQMEVPTNLQNRANFEAYLATLDINNKSYGIGNELAGQAARIKARSDYLVSIGEDSLVEVLIDWLNSKQNPVTGLWTLYNTADFDGINGLLKILAVYSGVGEAFPHPVEAAKSAFSVLGNGEYLGSVCYVYNIWLTLRILNEHVVKYNKDANAYEQLQQLKMEILMDAPRAIRETAKALSLFRRDDGSFSFTQEYSCQTSQGMQVTLRQQVEGDVNASNICLMGTVQNMCLVLGISYVTPYSKADGLKIMEIFDEIQPVIKTEEEVNNEPLTFDDDTIGSVPALIADDVTNGSSGTISVVKDPRLNAKGNVLEINSNPDGGDSVIFRSLSSSMGGSCFVFDADLCYTEDCPNGYYSQIYMYPSCYMLAVYIDSEGIIHLWDSSSNNGDRVNQDLGIEINRGDWFNLRLEYYPGDRNEVRIKTYIDGELRAVSDNYFDNRCNKVYPDRVSTPSEDFTYVDINMFSNATGRLLIDNVLTTKVTGVYSATDKDLKVNVDKPIVDNNTAYDFEELPDIIDITEGNDSIKVSEENQNLAFSTTVNGGSSVIIPSTKIAQISNCISFKADFVFDANTPLGTLYQISFTEDSKIIKFETANGDVYTGGNSPLLNIHLVVTQIDGKNYVALANAPTGKTAEVHKDTKMPLGEKVTLEIKFFTDAQTALFYVNDNLCGSTDKVSSGARFRICENVVMSNVSSVNADFTMDNLKVEKISASFDEAVKPKVERVDHNFDAGLNEGVIKDSSIVIADGKLSFTDATSGAVVKFPNNLRASFTNVAIFEFKISDIVANENGSIMMLALTDEDGNIIIAFEVKKTNDGLILTERTQNNDYNLSLAAIPMSGATITIEYFTSMSVANIYVNGTLTNASSVTYTPENSNLDYAFATITKINENVSFAIDDAFAESYFKLYNKAPVVSEPADGEVVTFENNITSLIPSQISAALKSPAAALAVKEVLVYNTYSKVAVLETGSGGNDEINVLKTLSIGGAKVTIFEADLKLNFVDGDKSIQIFLEGTKRAYLMNIFEENGMIKAFDFSTPNGGGKTGQRITLAENNTWFNLRIEYYNGTGFEDVRIKTYVNDELVYVSNNFYDSQKAGATPFNDITYVKLYTYGGCVGEIYVDNVSLINSNQECANDKLTVDMTPIPEPDTPPEEEPDPDAGKYASKYFKGFGSPIYNFDSIKKAFGGLYDNTQGIHHIIYSSNGTGCGLDFKNNGERAYIEIGSLKTKDNYNTNVLLYGKSDNCTATGRMAILETYQHEEGNVFAFESNIYIKEAALADGATKDVLMQLNFCSDNYLSTYNGGSTTAYTLNFRLVDGNIMIGDTGISIDASKWYNFAVEYYYTEGYAKIYLDGVEVSKFSVEKKRTVDINHIQFILPTECRPFEIAFDNLFIGTVYKEGVRPAKDPVDPDAGKYASKYFKGLGSPIYSFESVKNVFGDLYENNKGIFHLIYSSNGTGPNASFKENGERAYIIADTLLNKAGDDTKALYYGKNANCTATGRMAFPETYEAENGNVFAFETDLFINEAQLAAGATGDVLLQLNFCSGEYLSSFNGGGNTAYSIKFRLVDGKIMVGDTGISIDASKWYNFAIEFYYTEGYAQLYLDGEMVKKYDVTLNKSLDINHVQFILPADAKPVEFIFDNVFIGTVYKEGIAAPEAPAPGTGGGNEGGGNEGSGNEGSGNEGGGNEGGGNEGTGGDGDEGGDDVPVETDNRNGGKYYTANGGEEFDYTNLNFGPVSRKEIVVNKTTTKVESSSASFIKTTSLNSDKTLQFGTTDSNMAEFYMKSQKTDGTLFVLETSIMLTSAKGTNLVGKEILNLGFTTTTRAASTTTMPTFYGNTAFVLKDDGNYLLGETTVKANMWYNFRIVYDTATKTLTTYINDKAASTQTADLGIESFTHMGFTLAADATGANVYFDNTFVGNSNVVE